MSHFIAGRYLVCMFFVCLLVAIFVVGFNRSDPDHHQEVQFHIETRPELSKQDHVANRVTGKLAGYDFCVDDAYFDSPVQTLTLRQGKGFFMDMEVTVFLNIDLGESPEERTLEFSAKSEEDIGPFSIHLRWRKPDDLVEFEVCARGYEASIEFGKWNDGKLPGKLLLRLPDRFQCSMAGNFEASTDRFPFIRSKR